MTDLQLELYYRVDTLGDIIKNSKTGSDTLRSESSLLG